MTSLTRPGFLVSAIATVPKVCLAQYSFRLSGIPSFRAIVLNMCSIPLSSMWPERACYNSFSEGFLVSMPIPDMRTARPINNPHINVSVTDKCDGEECNRPAHDADGNV